MKKNLSFLFALVFAGLAISSCEDVPAPYDVPGSGSDTTVVTNDSIYLQETFASKFGDFTVVTEEGTPWVNKYSCATATGYDNTTKTTTASKSWLISKPIDLTKSNGAYVSFDYILRYVSAAASNKVLVSTDYAGDPTKATWTDITGTLTEGKDYTTFASYKTNLPTSVIGKSSVVIAFYYSCTTNSSTWEVKNLLVKEGKADETTPVTPVTGDYINETFSSSLGVFTANTIQGTPWTIDFSTAKASGYDSSTKTTTASKGYIISSPVDLSKSTGAYLSFSYILRYVSAGKTENKVLVSTDYSGDPSKATWTDITGTLTEGTDWKTFATYSANLPASVIGKSNVVIALYYSCTTSSSTWEVKNLTLKEGSTGTTGGDTGGGTGGGTTTTTSDVTYAMADLGLANATALGNYTLKDGTTLTFSQEGGSNAPSYYTTGLAARMYAQNSVTIYSAAKKITSIVLTCADPYNGTKYNGNDMLYGMADNAKVSATKTDTSVSFASLNCNTLKIVNDYSETKSGVQLRIVKIGISYAK
jgi:hypothetical protein